MGKHLKLHDRRMFCCRLFPPASSLKRCALAPYHHKESAVAISAFVIHGVFFSVASFLFACCG